MKTIKSIAASIVAVCITGSLALAQNYKAPKIDASGKVTDEMGMYIGTVTKNGEIKNAKGEKLAYVDSEGTLIDGKTGKKLGKAEKNGNFMPYFKETADGKGLTSTAPMNGTCMVKDASGKVVMEVHENYKQFGACAYHCLKNNMKHNEVLEKTSMASYVCPMHGDVVSDKPGNCSKCGMPLEKK